MAPPKGPARLALDELLADGLWHDREEAIRHVTAHIPPGHAIRTADKARRTQRTRAGYTGTPNPNISRRHDDQAAGARHVARATVGSAIAGGTVQRQHTPDGRVLIRKAP